MVVVSVFPSKSEHREILAGNEEVFSSSLQVYVLKGYGVVYVKPVAGSQGIGVTRAWYDESRRIHVKRTIERERIFEDIGAAAKHIDQLRNGKMYIVQQGIHLAKIGGLPWDIRVMVQREKPGGVWRFSGMCAKVAGRGSVVTNTALSGGRVIDVEQALRSSLGWKEKRVREMVAQLQRLGIVWANHFDGYQKYRELGFDVAVDTKGRIWLIEQNTAPSHALFARNRANLVPYRRIQYRWGAYQRALGKRLQKRPQKS